MEGLPHLSVGRLGIITPLEKLLSMFCLLTSIFCNTNFNVMLACVEVEDDGLRFSMTAVPSYARSKQARGYKAFTRRCCVPFMCECCRAGMHNA